MKRKIFSILFAVALVVGFVLATAVPAGAIGVAQTLNVANWTTPTTLANVLGRQATIKVDETYHMWYASADEKTLYHTSSTNPGSFETGTPNTFDTAPAEVGSVTVCNEDGTYYMIAYGATNKVFNIYTLADGNSWVNKSTVFGGTGLPSDYSKIDGPYLFKDGSTYKLYFQVKNAAATSYSIYTAETSEALALIADGNDDADFILANGNAPILEPEAGGADGNYMMHPMVVKDGGMYYMWYSAYYSKQQQIGFASSTDGYTWVKSRGNPILPSPAVGEPSVIKDGDTWRMWYLAGNAINYLTATGPFEFSSIQDAINAALPGDTINVAAGTYIEQVVINKDLTLSGTGNPVIKAPASPTGYKFPEGDTNTWDPIVLVFGGTADGSFNITGTGQVTVNISGITVDGNARIPSPTSRRAVGILYRNVVGGVTHSTVQNMGYSTSGINSWGIMAYGNSDVTFHGNIVSGYAKGGFVVNGSRTNPSMPKPHAVIDDNTVTGPPYDPAMTLAPNGIQIGWGATGSVTNNTVTQNGFPGTAWGGTGILIQSSPDVIVEGNTATGNDYGIATAGYESNNSYATGTIIRNNTVESNAQGIRIERRSVDTLVQNNTITENGDGIHVGSDPITYPIPAVGTVIHSNVIFSNTVFGVSVETDVLPVDATGNWWGDASGPTHTSNPAGTGDAVSNNVDYSPWWGASYLTGTAPNIELVAHPWSWYTNDSIQEAIDAATAGDTINVTAGTYNENVTINKSNLQLLGAKAGIPAGPEANPAGRSLPAEESIINGKIVEAKKASGSTIDGFTILSAGQHGISPISGDVIKNNIIDGGLGNTAKGGIWSVSGGGYLITNNNIRNYKYGMMFDGPATAPQCEISGNYITKASFAGIVAMASWSNGHTFSYNVIENSGAGIHLGQGGHQVSYNTIRNNTGSGIYILAGPEMPSRTFGIQITYNTIEGNGTGIELAIYLDSDDAGAINNQAHYNNIVGNTNGVLNNHTAKFDATNNWWGSKSGPKHDGNTFNVGYQGDAVSDNVNYCPWLDGAFDADPPGTSFAPVTSEEGEFSSIQAAVDAATGTTITCAAGTYNENVTVNKTLSLLSNPGAVLEGTGTGNGFLIQAPNVTIDGFEVRNFAIGIRTYGGPSDFGDLDILNCNIHNNTQNGMLIVYDIFGTVTIENCQINSNSQNGIGIANGAQIGSLQITDTSISNNGATTVYSGIYIASPGTTLSNLTASNLTMEGNKGCGILIDDNSSVSNASFSGANITGSDVNFSVRSAQVNGLTFQNCQLSNSPTNHGLWIWGGTVNNLNAQNTSFSHNKNQGFYVSDRGAQSGVLNNATISGGFIEGNAWGILTRASTVTNLAVSGVTIRNNDAGSGLSVASGTVNGLTVENCTFQNNAWEHLDIGVKWIGAVTVSDVEITGNTFSTGTGICIHIDSLASFGADDIAIHFNNFVSGTWGVSNNSGVTVKATNNWWGDNSGPTHTGNPGGTGDAVSDNVDYEPWIGAPVAASKSETVAGSGTVDAKGEADTEVDVSGAGSPTVTVTKYSSNPGSGFGGDTGKYFDVHIDDVTNVTEIEIRMYYKTTDIGGLVESSLRLRWWDGTGWVVCSDSGVDTTDITGPPPYSGYMWAKITATSTPSLADLTGTPFGGGGTAAAGSGGGGGAPPTTLSKVGSVSLLQYLDSQGRTRIKIILRSDDGVLTIIIFSETLVHNVGGNLLESMGIVTLATPPPPPGYVLVGHAYDCLPDGANFAPKVTMTFAYDPADIPDGVSENDLLVAYWDGDKWVNLTTTINAAANTATTESGHFTPFALMAYTGLATFSASNLSIQPLEVQPKEVVTITLSVANTGDTEGSYNVVLKINGIKEAEKSITVASGESQDVSFSVTKEEAGSYNVTVEGLSGSFTVAAPSAAAPSAAAAAAPPAKPPITWPVVGIIAAVVIVGLIIFFAVRRRTY
jgi:parallel beta-helix repeat protein